jgi:hypothetical protein
LNNTPALLSLRVAHLLHEKKNDEAMKVLTDGVKTFVSFYLFKKILFIIFKANTPSHADIVEHCAALYERCDKHKDAAEYLEMLRKFVILFEVNIYFILFILQTTSH